MRNSDPRIVNWVIDFVVLGVTFFVSCLLFSAVQGQALIFQTLAYSSILLICVRLSKRTIVAYKKSVGEASRQILGNGAGILFGTCIMLVLEKLISASSEVFVAIIFSSVMAFFVLGTLSPIVHKAPIMHKKSSSF
ncbi:MAG: hypothetical protein HKN34_02725 [Gammaproteobacteria bacterium]|nr:hypothetical protein [Gammaproteobacteria bacterium]